MQIIVPMTGIGRRFIDAGYKDPKPLIKADGNPIIKYVVDMFPGEKDFIFICNSKHLEETDMRSILTSIAPECKIVEISPHKLGPVYAVLQIQELIKDDEEVIVNYCDFGKYWDYKEFLSHTRNRNADGAIPAYKGFHPHMLGSTNYAFMRSENQWMLEIQEKKPFTDNRMEEYASDGTYYFKKGSYVKKYFKELIDLKLDLNGEYYVSMIFNLLLRDKLKVSIYKIQHMLQWGTPADLEEYQKWSDYFTKIIKKNNRGTALKDSVTLIPLAGKGMRFSNEGYKDPKPLINVSGKPMIIQAADFLPASEKHVFLCLKEHLVVYPLKEKIKEVYNSANVISIDTITEGQACTCNIGMKTIDDNSSVLIGACDNGMLWNEAKYKELISSSDVDGIVFTFKHHPSSVRNPKMYGWVKTDSEDNVEYISVKKPISDDPYNDHAIVGAFYFKKASYFKKAYDKLIKNNIRINNEFYVDSLMNEMVKLGFKVKAFQVDHYICWGTPDDLRTYQYWQSFFHKSSWHSYRLDLDYTLNKSSIKAIAHDAYNHYQDNK